MDASEIYERYGMRLVKWTDKGRTAVLAASALEAKADRLHLALEELKAAWMDLPEHARSSFTITLNRFGVDTQRGYECP